MPARKKAPVEENGGHENLDEVDSAPVTVKPAMPTKGRKAIPKTTTKVKETTEVPVPATTNKKRAGADKNGTEDVRPKKMIKSISSSKLPSTSASVEAAKAILKNKKRRQTLVTTPQNAGDQVEEPMDVVETSSHPKSNGGTVEVEDVNPLKRLKRDILPRHARGQAAVYVFGNGEFGQLGIEASKRVYPALVVDLQDQLILEVAAGGIHTIVLTKEGKVYSFGCNDEKALGRATSEQEEEQEPNIVELPKNIVQISCGDSHSAALTQDGEVYVWGNFRGADGALGLIPSHKKEAIVKPELISHRIGVPIVKICSGNDHLVMLGEDGRVYTCGDGQQGQLGRRLPTRSTRSNELKDKTEYWLTPLEARPVLRKKFVDIWTGGYTTFCQTENGDIYVCGGNNYDQLGVKTKGKPVEILTKSRGFAKKKWIDISGGEHHTLALDDEGHVYALGRRDDGRLGLGKSEENSVVTTPQLIESLKNEKCVQVAAGTSCSYALTEDGKLYSWGFGENYQLAAGKSSNDLFEPTRCVLNKDLEDLTGVIFVSGGGQHSSIIKQLNAPKKAKDSKDEVVTSAAPPVVNGTKN